jgi:predicted regulator of Ras-like GTPase activity (Roadblock/LC7/MglB family)
MPRMEEVLAELAALRGVRSAVLGGFDGLLVDRASRRDALDLGAAAAFADPPGDDLIGVETGARAVRPDDDADLDGAVVEIAHAWHALGRACVEHLHVGPAREVILVADDGIALAHTVGDGWFALVWAAPTIDVAVARAALRRAAALLAEAVA